MRAFTRRCFETATSRSLAAVFLALAARAQASEPNAQRVNHFVGAAGESVGIQVPPFHGIEPRLSLSYSSEARNGFAGMGWNLSGVSTIDRANSQYGAPAQYQYEPDTFLLDGQAVLACPAGSPYPSCATGGTHYTQQESYLKIKKVSDVLWQVYGKDGTKTEFTPIHTAPGLPTLRLGQRKVVDTHGNTVDYNWAVNVGGINGNTYLSSITYNGYMIVFNREPRPDVITRSGLVSDIARLGERLKSIVVKLDSGTDPNIRAYKPGYAASAASGKSLLTSVQMYGRDVIVDGAGTIISGTSLPAQTFSYQPDVSASSFGNDVQLSTSGPPPTAPGTVENVVWSFTGNARGTGDGSTLTADAIPDDWNKWGYSSRAISSGLGYVEFEATAGQVRKVWLGSNGFLQFTDNGVHYAAIYGNGEWLAWIPVTLGSKLRIEIVASNAVQWKIDGNTVTALTTQMSYPVVVNAQMYAGSDAVANVRLSGSLVNYWGADCGGAARFSGDFNGDGRQDFVCRNSEGSVAVTLATASGFSNPTIWAGHSETLIGAGDFNNDGRDDVVFFNSYSGQTYVGLSDGFDFGAITGWGAISGHSPSYPYTAHACKQDGAAIVKVADFTGDGRSDLLCYTPADPNRQFVSVSQVTNFDTYIFSETDCPTYSSASADLNGDGREDMFCMGTNANPGSGDVRPLISLGWFFTDLAVLSSFCSASEFSFGDWNGDGTTDAACANNGRVALQTGEFFVDMGTTTQFCVSGQRLSADLDGDGAAEWVCNNPGTPSNDIEVRRWTGLAFGPAQPWRAGFCAGTVKAADYNGDGKKDLLCEATGVVIYAGTKNVKADLLTASANGIGGSSTLAYTTTTQHLTNSTAGLPSKYILTATTAGDGRTPPATTTFAYAVGGQDDKERKFYGFQTVWEFSPKLPGEAAAPFIGRRFRIDAAGAGRMDMINRYDGAGNVLFKTIHEYTVTETTGVGARRTALLTATWNYQHSGLTPDDCSSWPCPGARRTKVEYSYDNYGNVREVRDHGDGDIVGDETFTRYSNAPNTEKYIVGLMTLTQRWAGTTDAGAVLSQVVLDYDGYGWSVPPTKGDLSRRHDYLAQEDRYVHNTSDNVYDGFGNLLTVYDATNRASTVALDPIYHVHPVSATNGAGETTTTTWDYLCGVPLTTTDPNGVTTTFATDALCRPTTTTLASPSGPTTTTYYLDLGGPLQRTQVNTPGPDGAADWSQAYFDGFGRTYQTVRRGPAVDQVIVGGVAFDPRGNVASQTPAYYWPSGTPKATTFEYDAFNRPVKTTLPDGETRLTSYPGMSSDGFFRSTQTNELGQSSTTKFDVFGRVRKSEKPTTSDGVLVTTRNYDILGRMVSMVDPVGNTWTYAFDGLGRNRTKNDPDAGLWTYTYDDAGRVLTQTDAKSQTTTLGYDSAGRLSTKANPTETVTTTYSQPRNGYFNTGRPTTVASSLANGTLQFDYDALGRVVKQTRTIDSTSYTVQRNYDTAGYLRGMQYPDGDVIGQFGGAGTQLAYDQAGRLNSIPGILTGVTYNALGAPLVQTNANGSTTTKTYDANRFWLKAIGTVTPSLTLQNLAYTLNEAGMATTVTSPFGTEGWTYGYDELNRLTSSTNTGASADNQTWTYDTIGRITNNSRIGSYSYGSAKPHAVTAAGSNTYTSYDNNGNLLLGGGRALTWDANNMITQVAMGGNTTNFTYGPDGDRIKKTSGSAVVRYPFGDDYEIAPNGTVTKYFNAGFGVIAKKAGTTLHWLHTDRMGSINATTDTTGAEMLRRSYRSYGELLGREAVVWTGHVNAASSANALQKTSTAPAYDAGAVSMQQILSGDGYVEFTAGNQWILAGLSHGNSGESWDDVDYMISLGGELYVWEGGVNRGDFGPLAVGDKLRVGVEGGVVKYRKNGNLIYTSTVAPTYPLLVDTSFYYQGTRIEGAVISGATPSGNLESLGYIGQRTDTETGLTYLHARYYDSALGMFLSPDPAGADRNSYRYGSNDPVNRHDRSGRADCPVPSDFDHKDCVDVPGGGGNGGGGVPGGGNDGPGGGKIPGCDQPKFAAAGGCDDGPGGGGPDDPPPPLPTGPDCTVTPRPQGCPIPPDEGCPVGFAAMGECGPVVKTPKGCETAILGVPCVPKSATPEQVKRLTISLGDALGLLRHPPCNAFFGGQGADKFAATRYLFYNTVSDPAVARTSMGGNVIQINDGRFVVDSAPWTIGNTGSFFSGPGFGALFLLHELGHDLRVLPDDSASQALSLQNSAKVNDTCFR